MFQNELPFRISTLAVFLRIEYSHVWKCSKDVNNTMTIPFGETLPVLVGFFDQGMAGGRESGIEREGQMK